MKFAFLLTQDCNLDCKYCYIHKNRITLDRSNSKKAVEYILRNSLKNEKLDIGFFGGEPLLEFELLKDVVRMFENHPEFPFRQTEFQVTTNGTIFSRKIANFLVHHNIGMGISCDGIPTVQDELRRFTNGRPSSNIIERNIRKALDYLPVVMVNAVYTPITIRYLPESIEYLYSLGLRRIFVNPDFCSMWTLNDIPNLHEAYDRIISIYCRWHEAGDPAFISMIDGKLMVILKDGYDFHERCHMGKKEFAIAPSGNIFPCERLVGDGSMNEHCIGSIDRGVDYKSFCKKEAFRPKLQSTCTHCTLKKYCMTWCGCSNYFSTGHYNQVGPFICASEKESINAALHVFQKLEPLYGTSIIEVISGKRCPESAN